MPNLQLPVPEMINTWQFWVVAAACGIICEVLKQVPYIKEHPWILNLANLALGILLLGVLCGFSGENVLFGILASAAAIFAYEMIKNIYRNIVGDEDVKAGGTDD